MRDFIKTAALELVGTATVVGLVCLVFVQSGKPTFAFQFPKTACKDYQSVDCPGLGDCDFITFDYYCNDSFNHMHCEGTGESDCYEFPDTYCGKKFDCVSLEEIGWCDNANICLAF